MSSQHVRQVPWRSPGGSPELCLQFAILLARYATVCYPCFIAAFVLDAGRRCVVTCAPHTLCCRPSLPCKELICHDSNVARKGDAATTSSIATAAVPRHEHFCRRLARGGASRSCRVEPCGRRASSSINRWWRVEPCGRRASSSINRWWRVEPCGRRASSSINRWWRVEPCGRRASSSPAVDATAAAGGSHERRRGDCRQLEPGSSLCGACGMACSVLAAECKH